ncbi:MAG: helicase HerA-like domain-containing protein [Candidatus Berkiella sp.]
MGNFTIGIDNKEAPIHFNLEMANRHGLVAGATGTGKTVTLQVLAEAFSREGVAVFTADVKGDLAGIAYPANLNDKLSKRISLLKIQNYTPEGNPVVFWDIYGKKGHPLRTTISEMGPLLLGRLLDLNDTQQGVLSAAFSLADDEGLLLLDLKDLRSLLDWMGQHSAEYKSKYGNMSSATIGAIQRGLLSLNEAGADQFFGEPALNVQDLFGKDSKGHGNINILDATKLVNDGRLYSTFLLWLLSELFETLPEVGDQEKPKLVFFFDEAHLLFNSAPKPLIEKIEQLVRLIRSKGVGVYFVTQTPLDVPESVLGQLGNRVQHALRAFTPKDQKAVKVTAETFRQNPELQTQKILTELAVGEALVSLLETSGTPAIVQQVRIYPPTSRIGPITPDEYQVMISRSPYAGTYEKAIDRESAYERIQQKISPSQAQKQPEYEEPQESQPKRAPGRPKDSALDAMLKSTARSVGSSLGRQIVRGILGSIFTKRR